MKRLSLKIVGGTTLDLFRQIDRPRRLSMVSVEGAGAAACALSVKNGAGVQFFRVLFSGAPAFVCTGFELIGNQSISLPPDFWVNPGDVLELDSDIDADVVVSYEEAEEE